MLFSISSRTGCALRQAASRAAAALAALLPAVAGAQLAGSVVTTDQVRAELLAHAPDGVAAGKPLWLGLKIEHKPDWHTYWRNPGDSGLPTTLDWKLPSGLTAGDIAWPTPKKLPVGPMVNYGYEGTLLLSVPVNVSAAFAAAAGSPTVPIKLEAQWLVCKDVCIPEQGSFTLALPVQAATGLHGGLFDAAQRAVPRAVDGVTGSAEIVAGTVGSLKVELRNMPAPWQGKPLALFAELFGMIDHAAKVEGRWQGSSWQAQVPLSPERLESPSTLDAVLTTPGQPAGLRVALDVKGSWPALAGAAAGAGAAAAGTGATTPAPSTAAPRVASPPPGAGAAALPAANAVSSMTLWSALLLALIGGLLLNLMPCVLPVLSLKVLGLSKLEGGSRARAGAGLAYTAGVLMSMLALAGALLALRGAGEAVGWGFQLQSPGVVATLAALFTLIGLNLAGVFEVGMPVPGSVAGARVAHPWLDAWLTGVLAVAVAAPCTAPFMGAALGFAIGLPAAQALLVFAVLGLGLALPFLVTSLVPGIASRLPKPGAWMVRFKVAMAFPMFATVVWLVWVLAQQAGPDAAAALLALLVALAFAAWTWGLRQMGSGWPWPAAGAALAAAVLAWAWPTWRDGAAAPVATAAAAATDRWQAWSPEKVAELTGAGRTVFVDYTAAWCVSCQVNKRTTLDTADVRAAFDRHKVVTLRADWTRRDATIAAELARLGRNGVPVYAVYRAGAAQPTLLPEILTPSIVVDALAGAPASALAATR